MFNVITVDIMSAAAVTGAKYCRYRYFHVHCDDCDRGGDHGGAGGFLMIMQHRIVSACSAVAVAASCDDYNYYW